MLRRGTKGSHFFDTETFRSYATITRSNPKSINQLRIQGKGPEGLPPLFLDQTDGVEKNFWRLVSHLSQGLDDRAPPYLKVWNCLKL